MQLSAARHHVKVIKHKNIVEGLRVAANLALEGERDHCVTIVNRVVDVFRSENVQAGEAMVVLYNLTKQLARLADETISASADATGFTVPECEQGHVLTALALMAGYDGSELRLPLAENDNSKARAN
jgi:hypothetical protein